MADLNEISGCEVCGSDALTSVLDLGDHPLCDDLVAVGDSRVCREYPIEILFCGVCLTAHQRFQVPQKHLFPDSYHYRSRFTADVLDGMAGLVKSVTRRLGSVEGRKVLDIGCNDGSLLDFFRNRGASTIGIEPTGAVKDAADRGHAVFHEYLSPECADRVVTAHGKPDVIAFTNVFAHIEDLAEVLESLRRLTGEGTLVVIENHYLGSILAARQFDTFYHEHPRSYSYTSFTHIARSLGTRVLGVEFPSRYGGNIRTFLGNGSIDAESVVDDNALRNRERGITEQFALLRQSVVRWRETKGRLIDDWLKRDGVLRAKAFPGRAAILVKLLGLDGEAVSAVYEKPGSLKIGHYLPGTRIPIESDETLFSLPDQALPILNLAWHIPDEIRRYLASNGYSGPVIDIVNAEDFEPPPQ